PDTALTVSTQASAGSSPQQKTEPPPTPPLQAPAGVTALSGIIRNVAGQSLANVTVNLDCNGKVTGAKTDSQGRFLISNVTTGHCQLETNGATVSGNAYGRFFQGVDLQAGRTYVLPNTIWMTAIDQQHQAALAASAAQEQII